MALLIQCVLLCLLFTLVVMPAQYKDPLSMIMSYPPEIIKRVEELPQYQNVIKRREKSHIGKKTVGFIFLTAVLSAAAYFSGCKSFGTAFVHVFTLFASVNVYDLVILDWGIFCHSRKLRIPGTEDMEKSYRNYAFHLKGAVIGLALGAVGALLSGCIIHIISVI
ncbi:MAG: hypothetical protein J6B08_04890 [Ruminiclostridium sp.]|nr:hypothetical protein [Ruminiclostridium sp.]